jgi:hypothetical protein
LWANPGSQFSLGLRDLVGVDHQIDHRKGQRFGRRQRPRIAGRVA